MRGSHARFLRQKRRQSHYFLQGVALRPKGKCDIHSIFLVSLLLQDESLGVSLHDIISSSLFSALPVFQHLCSIISYMKPFIPGINRATSASLTSPWLINRRPNNDIESSVRTLKAWSRWDETDVWIGSTAMGVVGAVTHVGSGLAWACWLGRRMCRVLVLVAQSCPTLCKPVDCSPQSFSVHGILQARILEWVAISFSRRSSRPRDRTWVSCIAGGCFTFWATTKALGGRVRPVVPQCELSSQ